MRLCVAAILLFAACGGEDARKDAGARTGAGTGDWAALREAMVQEAVADRGVQNARVLAALRKVPRHEFVPEEYRKQSYEDRSLPIGQGQTIGPPYIVAIMTEQAAIGPEDRVLEIGTGSGYGAAVLAEVAREVYTIEILKPLAERARETLKRLGYDNVYVRQGDGYEGWSEAAPFDAIVVTAAPPKVPEPLKRQLKVGGTLVVPVGKRRQHLRVLTRTKEGFVEHPLFEVRFVPMTGEAQKGD